MRVYLVVYNEDCGTEREILDFLDKQPEILNWETILPSSVFIATRKHILAISKILQKEFMGGMFFITLINTMQIDGLLPGENWDFINNPKPFQDK